MMNSSNNYSDVKYGIQSDAERYFWAVYFLLALLSSLIGDSLILIASFQREAFKVSKLIVTVIQHIAIADLGSAIFSIPSLTSLVANKWVLGNALCYVKVYASYAIYISALFFIALLTMIKFLLLRYPLIVSGFSTKRVHQICALLWILSLISPVAKLAVEKDDISFDYRVYACEYGYNAYNKLTKLILMLTQVVIPNVVIIAATIPTLQYLVNARKSARRVRSSDPWRGALTVFLTAAAYTVSTLPFCFYYIAANFAKKDLSERILINFHRISSFLFMINTVANVFIYSLAIPSFRKYVSSKFLSIVRVSGRDTTTATAGTYISLDPVNFY